MGNILLPVFLFLFGFMIWATRNDENRYAALEAACEQHDGTYIRSQNICVAAKTIPLDIK